MIDAKTVLAALPAALRDAVLDSYREITKNYIERRWEPSELNGGKFCEAAFSVVDGAVKKKFPPQAKGPSNMVLACRALEQVAADPALVGDRSLRIFIPRVLVTLYDVRNNRGVGHIGGDVNANHMDAEAVLSMASWVLAELIRIFHGVTTSEAQETVDALVERKTPLVWDVGGRKRVLDPGMPKKQQVLVLLHHSAGWVSAPSLFESVDYSDMSMFRSAVLRQLHDARQIEFDKANDRAQISPLGVKVVEDKLLRPRGG